MWKPGAALVVGLLASSCAHQDPAARAAEQARLQRCASIEIFPLGVRPPRPYRILGPLAVTFDGISSHRDRTLQNRACDLGADAVMDVSERTPLTVDRHFATPEMVELAVELSGTAVAYTDAVAVP